MFWECTLVEQNPLVKYWISRDMSSLHVLYPPNSRSCDHPWAWKNFSTDEAEVKGWTQLEIHQSLVSKIINFVHFFLSSPTSIPFIWKACSSFWVFCVVFYTRYWALFSPQVKDETCFSWCRQWSPLMLLSLWRDEVYELCKTWELWRSLHIVDGSRIPNQNGRRSRSVLNMDFSQE